MLFGPRSNTLKGVVPLIHPPTPDCTHHVYRRKLTLFKVKRIHQFYNARGRNQGPGKWLVSNSSGVVVLTYSAALLLASFSSARVSPYATDDRGFATFQKRSRAAFPNLERTLSAMCWQQNPRCPFGERESDALIKPFSRSLKIVRGHVTMEPMALHRRSRWNRQFCSFSDRTSSQTSRIIRLFSSKLTANGRVCRNLDIVKVPLQTNNGIHPFIKL